MDRLPVFNDQNVLVCTADCPSFDEKGGSNKVTYWGHCKSFRDGNTNIYTGRPCPAVLPDIMNLLLCAGFPKLDFSQFDYPQGTLEGVFQEVAWRVVLSEDELVDCIDRETAVHTDIHVQFEGVRFDHAFTTTAATFNVIRKAEKAAQELLDFAIGRACLHKAGLLK